MLPSTAKLERLTSRPSTSIGSTTPGTASSSLSSTAGTSPAVHAPLLRVASLHRPHLPSERLFEYHVQVRDSGIGIPAAALEHLFKSFSMVSSKEQQRKFGGTGLGLSISRQLCELMGGKMWVESTEGVGSVFHFTFRVPASFDGAGAYLQGISQELVGKRMLLVKVNERASAMIASMVGQWGLVTLPARTQAEVEALLRANTKFDFARPTIMSNSSSGQERTALPFDLALVDFDLGAEGGGEGEAEATREGGAPSVRRSSSLSLTAGDEAEDQSMEPARTSPPQTASVATGVDVAQLIRRSFPSSPPPPVLMLCALSQRQRSMRTVVDYFLSKPIKPNKLFAAILSALRPKPVIGLPGPSPIGSSVPPTTVPSAGAATVATASGVVINTATGLPASPLTPNLSALTQSFSDTSVQSPAEPAAGRAGRGTVGPSASAALPPTSPKSPSGISPPSSTKASAKRKREMEAGRGSATASGATTPAAKAAKARTATTPVSGEGSGETPSLLFNRCPLRILVAEDNSINVRVICHMLNRLGYTDDVVDVAADGKMAFDFVVKAAAAARAKADRASAAGGAEEEREVVEGVKRRLSGEVYHVVFMDVFMPVMDGFESTIAIRSDPRVNAELQPYIIALTANAMAGDKQKCLEAGMELFLSKPVTLGPLVQALKTAHAATAKKQRQTQQRAEEARRKSEAQLQEADDSQRAFVLSPSTRPYKLSQRRSNSGMGEEGFPASAGMVDEGSGGGRDGSGASMPQAGLHRISSAPLHGTGGGEGSGGEGGGGGGGVSEAAHAGATSRMLASQQFLAAVALQPYIHGSPQTVYSPMRPPQPPASSSAASTSSSSSSSFPSSSRG